MGHFYPRQTILVPAGLITEPNEYGQYPPGALLNAHNVVMRAPGKLAQAPNVRNSVSLGLAGATVHKLMPADSGVVYSIVDDSGPWRIFADGVLQTGPTISPPVFSRTGRITWAQCNGRVIVNGANGNIVHDPVPISTDFRGAGLPQVSIVGAALATDSPGWLEVDHMVGYRVCLVRRYSDDYTLRSTPSLAVKVHHGVGAFPPGTKATVNISVKWPSGVGIEPGDILELYRTDILATPSVTADPGGTFKLAREYILTAADLAAPPPGGLVLKDLQQPVEGTLRTAGRELYTNPGVEGETYANEPPPVAQCLVSFKGFCFYGHTTERAKLKVAFPGGLGAIMTGGGVASREKGIGHRTGNGTVTAGSAIITGVSAAQMVSVKPGQLWAGATVVFPLTAFVVSVGASSITMSQGALAAAPDWALDDAIEINGTRARIGSNSILQLLNDLDGKMEAQLNQTLSANPLYLTGFELTLMWNGGYPYGSSPLIARATNGANYSPPVAEWTTPVPDWNYIEPLVRKNRVAWSKEQQPEHVPSVSETFVGFGEIYAMNATRDSIVIWSSDGMHRLSGNGGSLGLGAWQTDYSNATLLLSAPQASTVLDELVYGQTNDGVVEIDSANNVKNLTAGVIGNLLPGLRYRENAGFIVERNERDGEILVVPGAPGFSLPWSPLMYVYNVKQRSWTLVESISIPLTFITAIGMHRLPPETVPDFVEPHVLLAGAQEPGVTVPSYASWDARDSFLESYATYQPLYGEDPLELKRWMWADYLFDAFSFEPITVQWNGHLSFGPITPQRLDVGTYARAGVPREVGLSHSLMPGFMWSATADQQCFEGISLALKQRTNQSKQR